MNPKDQTKMGIVFTWDSSCAERGNRTPMDRSPADFESAASTNFTTSAKSVIKLSFWEIKTRENSIQQ